MKQKRYKSEHAILAAIEECHQTAAHQAALAVQLRHSADEHSKLANVCMEACDYRRADEWREQAGSELAKAVKADRSAVRCIEVKAKKLGHALAAFQTVPMGFLGKDHAVVVNS